MQDSKPNIMIIPYIYNIDTWYVESQIEQLNTHPVVMECVFDGSMEYKLDQG